MTSRCEVIAVRTLCRYSRTRASRSLANGDSWNARGPSSSWGNAGRVAGAAVGANASASAIGWAGGGGGASAGRAVWPSISQPALGPLRFLPSRSMTAMFDHVKHAVVGGASSLLVATGLGGRFGEAPVASGMMPNCTGSTAATSSTKPPRRQ